MSKQYFQVSTGNKIIDSLSFSTKDVADLVGQLWKVSELDSENDFFKSIPFLFRMYRINEEGWN